jgi:streptomycin 6-kinase
MVAVPQSFRAMPRWWHDEVGRAWLAELPSLVAARCDAWHLDVDGAVTHGSNALVVPVRRGVERAVLRLAPPGDDVATEAAALAHWGGRGVVELLDVDLGARAFLLERLDPARSLQGLPIIEAVGVLGDLTRLLAVPAPASVTSTSQIARDSAASFIAEWEAVGAPTPRSLAVAAVSHAAWLSEQPSCDESVDGDLHFEQVLAGERHAWTVVDPVLLRGDREHDVGRVLWSRLDELPEDRDVFRAFDAFVAAADVPVERARAWVVVRSMSYLLWGLRRGLTWDPPKCIRLLDLFS